MIETLNDVCTELNKMYPKRVFYIHDRNMIREEYSEFCIATYSRVYNSGTYTVSNCLREFMDMASEYDSSVGHTKLSFDEMCYLLNISNTYGGMLI